MFRRNFKFRLYPNREQAKLLEWTLIRCRELYNAALQERRDAWKMRGVSLDYYDQSAQLPAIKEVRPEYKDIYAQTLQDVLRRVDKAFKAFFRRVKQGQKPGYPRFQGRGRYNSFTYPQGGWSIHNGKLTLTKIGTLKVKFHREVVGKVKTVTVKREGEDWYVYFACEVELEPLPPCDEAVGVDMGLNYFATLSTGEQFSNPRYLRKALDRLKLRQQALSRSKRGSHRRERMRKQVATLHHKVANQRHDFAHKLSRELVNRYGLIVFEKLQLANLTRRPKPVVDEVATAETGQTVYAPNGAAAKAGLNKSILDAGWGMFQQFCSYKAEEAGRIVLFVPPQYTSQTCSGCGQVKAVSLEERTYSCSCGVELDRDVNAAINILRLGSSQRSGMAVTPDLA